MRTSHIIFLLPIFLSTFLLPGCSSIIVAITSNPSGAVITCDHHYIGKTPMYYRVEAKSGFNNTYKFCAILPKYHAESKEFVENEWALNVKYVLDENIHFELKPDTDKQ